MSKERVNRIWLVSVGIGAYILGFLTTQVFEDRQEASEPAPVQIQANVVAPVAASSVQDDSDLAKAQKRDPRERIPWAEWTKLREKAPTSEQLEQFVEARGRSAESLVAAASFGKDGAVWLKEAMEKFPDSRLVQMTALTSDSNLTADERITWAERLKQSMPDNAVANILAATAKAATGDLMGSLDELRAVSEQRKFDDLKSTLALNRTDALLHAGFDYPEARALGRPDNAGQFTMQVHETAKALKSEFIPTLTGDARDEAIALGLALGNRLSEGDGSGDPAIELMGMSVEQMFLSAMNPEERPSFLEMSVEEAKASVLAQRKALLENVQNHSGLDSDISEYELLQFFDRAELLGAPAALEWMKQTRTAESESTK
ncbi:MAG: hypothetical protein R3F19_23540 [Verrucomicrobiales bacterium]